jgi:hypothetical protein
MNRKEGNRMKMIKKQLKDAYEVGDRIHFVSWRELLNRALVLSSVGYGVAVLGFSDMADNVLIITALPERKES